MMWQLRDELIRCVAEGAGPRGIHLQPEQRAKAREGATAAFHDEQFGAFDIALDEVEPCECGGDFVERGDAAFVKAHTRRASPRAHAVFAQRMPDIIRLHHVIKLGEIDSVRRCRLSGGVIYPPHAEEPR